MSLTSEVKNLVGKFVKNPVKSIIVLYLIKKILKPYVGNNESIDDSDEDIQVLQKQGDDELVYDKENNIYGVIKGVNISFYKNKDLALQDFNEKLEDIKMNKLERLYESIVKNSESLKEPGVPKKDGTGPLSDTDECPKNKESYKVRLESLFKKVNR